MSLIPGTVAAGFEGDQLVVHALDVNSGVESDVSDLEDRVAKLFVLGETRR